MQENKLTEVQSLELITSMINDSRTRLARNSGTPFLIWGYTIVAMYVASVIAIFITKGVPAGVLLHGIFPLCAPIIALIIMKFRKKEDKAIQSNSPAIKSLWLIVGIACCLIMLVSANHFIITLLISIGAIATGLIMKHKEFKVCGIIGMVMSVMIPFIQFYVQPRLISLSEYTVPADRGFISISDFGIFITLCYTIVILIVGTTLIIPGHILNNKYNK